MGGALGFSDMQIQKKLASTNIAIIEYLICPIEMLDCSIREY